MALSIFEVLRKAHGIDQDALAESFARHYEESRGYGPAMHSLLAWIRTKIPWQVAAPKVFDRGSYGNGAAMRVAPVGAYFADDPKAAAEQAELSAVVTHAHPEAAAGAIAVAVAAGMAWQMRVGPAPSREAFLDAVLPYVPVSEVRTGIERARAMPPETDVFQAAAALGNGARVSAQDTVPFVLWCAGRRLDSYEEALWMTASGLGDIDTTCAMVGGIVALYVGEEGIPAAWRAAREPLPGWPFGR
jgi:ADP-ribosylglycohydrolase